MTLLPKCCPVKLHSFSDFTLKVVSTQLQRFRKVKIILHGYIHGYMCATRKLSCAICSYLPLKDGQGSVLRFIFFLHKIIFSWCQPSWTTSGVTTQTEIGLGMTCAEFFPSQARLKVVLRLDSTFCGCCIPFLQIMSISSHSSVLVF